MSSGKYPGAGKAAQQNRSSFDQADEALEHLRQCIDQSTRLECVRDVANYCHDSLVPAMQALRTPIDELELIVDKDLWPVPTYGDLMFEV